MICQATLRHVRPRQAAHHSASKQNPEKKRRSRENRFVLVLLIFLLLALLIFLLLALIIPIMDVDRNRNDYASTSNDKIYTLITVHKSVAICRGVGVDDATLSQRYVGDEDYKDSPVSPSFRSDMIIRGNILRPQSCDHFLLNQVDGTFVMVDILNFESFALFQHNITTYFDPPLPGHVQCMALPVSQVNLFLRNMTPIPEEGECTLLRFERKLFQMVWLSDEMCEGAYQQWKTCQVQHCAALREYMKAHSTILHARQSLFSKDDIKESKTDENFLLTEMRDFRCAWERSLISVMEHFYGRERFNKIYEQDNEPCYTPELNLFKSKHLHPSSKGLGPSTCDVFRVKVGIGHEITFLHKITNCFIYDTLMADVKHAKK